MDFIHNVIEPHLLWWGLGAYGLMIAAYAVLAVFQVRRDKRRFVEQMREIKARRR